MLAEAAAHEVGHTYVITNGDGGLMARIVGQNAFAIVESRKDHFYYTELRAYIEFVRQSGTVVGLVPTQHGQTFGIPKLAHLRAKPIGNVESLTLAQNGRTSTWRKKN